MRRSWSLLLVGLGCTPVGDQAPRTVELSTIEDCGIPTSLQVDGANVVMTTARYKPREIDDGGGAVREDGASRPGCVVQMSPGGSLEVIRGVGKDGGALDVQHAVFDDGSWHVLAHHRNEANQRLHVELLSGLGLDGTGLRGFEVNEAGVVRGADTRIEMTETWSAVVMGSRRQGASCGNTESKHGYRGWVYWFDRGDRTSELEQGWSGWLAPLDSTTVGEDLVLVGAVDRRHDVADADWRAPVRVLRLGKDQGVHWETELPSMDAGGSIGMSRDGPSVQIAAADTRIYLARDPVGEDPPSLALLNADSGKVEWLRSLPSVAVLDLRATARRVEVLGVEYPDDGRPPGLTVTRVDRHGVLKSHEREATLDLGPDMNVRKGALGADESIWFAATRHVDDSDRGIQAAIGHVAGPP